MREQLTQLSRCRMGRSLLVVCCLATACATVPLGEPGPLLPKGQVVALTHSGTGPEVAALVEAFYSTAPEPSALQKQLLDLLVRYPDNPDLHEVAAYLALMTGDARASELHFIRAALDVGAAAPVLYLRGLDPNHELVVQACQLLARQHPDPEVRAAARHILMRADRLRADAASAEAQMRALGTLQQWRVIGAFDNDEGKGFNARYPPEDLVAQAGPVDLTGAVPGMLVPVRWRRVQTLDGAGAIPLDSMMWPNRQAVAYAVTFLTVKKAQDAILWLSSDAPVRVFVDGQLALSRETVASSSDPDNLAVALHLPAGPHALLVKSANRASNWWLGARLTGRDGAPLSEVSQSNEPPSAPAPPSSAAGSERLTFEELPTIRGLGPDLGKERASFLGGLMAVRAGDPKLGVRKESAFAKLSPGNPLGVFALALASRANDEQGKALDLLNTGVKRFGATLPDFLAQRARAYQEKNLLEKGQADAESFLALRPHDLDGELLLADIEGRRSFHIERCRTLEQILADHPNQTQPLRELAACRLGDGRRDEARALLEQARALVPGSYATLDAILDLDGKAFDHRRAESDVRLLRQLFPEALGLLIESGRVAERGQQLAAARRFFEEARDLSPDSAQPLEQLAELAYRQHDDADATRLWNDAAVRDPGNGLLSERLEHLQPTRLGFIEQLIPTDEAIDAAITAGETRVPQDGSHAELLLDDEVTEVHADGSLTRVVTTVMRAVNDQGRDAMIQAYVPTQGRLKLLKAFALSKTGERQEASSVHNGVLRFRNLTVGSTVVLQYVHYAPGGQFLPNEFASEWRFQSVAREHALSRWTLVLAKGRPLHVQITGDVAHTESEQQGFQVHRFEARDVPPLIEEPNSPPTHDLLRHVSVSTVSTWEEYARWERALLSDAFQESTDLGALAAKETEGAKTPREKLEKLTAYVAQEVRYQQDYENTIAGVRPHSCRQVLERGYGDCKDKAVLLISLGREVGLTLQYALLRTKPAGEVDRQVPNQQFNHAIVYVPKQEGFAQPFFVDATTDGLDVGSLRSDDQGAWSLVLDPLKKEGYEFIQIPYRSPDEQFSRSQLNIAVGSDGKVVAKDRMEMRGNVGSAFRMVLRNQAYARKMDEQIASYLFPASTLVGAEAGNPSDVWHPISLTLDIDATNTMQVDGPSRRLRLPAFLEGIDQLAALASRKAPLMLGVPETAETHISVQLPEGSRVLELPKDFEQSPKCLTIQRHSTASGAHVDVSLKLVRTCDEISTADYAAFREHLLKAVTRLSEQLAFVAPVKAEKVKALK